MRSSETDGYSECHSVESGFPGSAKTLTDPEVEPAAGFPTPIAATPIRWGERRAGVSQSPPLTRSRL
jgi:hypothetical protein